VPGVDYVVNASYITFNQPVPIGVVVLVYVNMTGVAATAPDRFKSTGTGVYALERFTDSNPNNYIVVLDGVVQAPTVDFNVTTPNITFNQDLVPNVNILIYVAAVGNWFQKAPSKITSDGGTTYLLTSYTDDNPENYFVTLNGVVQSPDDDFTINAPYIVFNQGIVADTHILVYSAIVIAAASGGGAVVNNTSNLILSLTPNKITATGGTNYILTNYTDNDPDNYIVTVAGVTQTPGVDFNLQLPYIVFSQKIPVGYKILVYTCTTGVGSPGPIGPAGPVGPAGPTGPAGVVGATGSGGALPTTTTGSTLSLIANKLTGTGGVKYALTSYTDNTAEDYVVSLDGVMQTPTLDFTVEIPYIIFNQAVPAGIRILVYSSQPPAFQKASRATYGVVKRTPDVKSLTDASGYITPADLDEWRVARGVVTTVSANTKLQYIYIQPLRVTALSHDILATDTVIVVTTTDGFETAGYIEIENTIGGIFTSEVIRYTGKTGNTFTGCVRGSTAVAWSTNSVVTLADRYTWTEPYYINETTVGYLSPKKVESYNSYDQDAYAAAGYVPNPDVARDYGVDLKTLKPLRIFKPFVDFDQAAAWANKNGFGVSDTVYLVMKAGYYPIAGSRFNSNVVINGVENTGYIGSYANNDGAGNKSVFIFRRAEIQMHDMYNVMSYDWDIGQFYADAGLTLKNLHILSHDEQYVRHGISSLVYKYPQSFRNLRDSNPEIGNRKVKYFKNSYEEQRNYYLNNSFNNKLKTTITIATPMPQDVVFSAVNSVIYTRGAVRIGTEVFEYIIKGTNTDGSVNVTLNARALDNSNKANHNIGDDINWYVPYVYGNTNSGYYKNNSKFYGVVSCGSGAFFIRKTFTINNVTIGAQDNGDFAHTYVWSAYRGALFNIDGTQGAIAYNLGGIRIRGNERYDWSICYGNVAGTATAGTGEPVGGGVNNSAGHMASLFNFSGVVQYRFLGDETKIHYEDLPQDNDVYHNVGSRGWGYTPNNTCSYTSSGLIQLEPTIDNSGNILGVDSRMFRTKLIDAVAGIDTVISGETSQLQYWPATGSGIIGNIEWFSYTGKSDRGNGKTVLTGVVRNSAGTLSHAVAWKASASLWLADYLIPSAANYTPGVRWNIPNENDSDWRKRGPKVTFFNGSRSGVTLIPTDYQIMNYYVSIDCSGFVGRFGNGSDAWFLDSGIDIRASNQYWNSSYRIGAPFNVEPAIPTISLTLNLINGISDSQNVISVGGQYNLLMGGVIKIGRELLRITAGAGSTNLNVERGYNKTIPVAHGAGEVVAFVDDTFISASRTIFKWDGINLNLSRFGTGYDSTESVSMAKQNMVVW